jgi:hypothetical protein
MDHRILEPVAVEHLAAGAGHQRAWLLRRHPLAALPHAIFLFRPLLLVTPGLEVGLSALRQKDTPGGLEVGPGLIEGRGRAGGALTGVTARIEPAGPAPKGLIARDTDTLGNRADAHVAIEYLPAFLAGISRSAAGELGHAPLKRSPTAQAIAQNAKPACMQGG